MILYSPPSETRAGDGKTAVRVSNCELFPEVSQVTVTTFRRMFLLTVREAVNERRGGGRERDGGASRLLVTNRADRVEFVNQNYNFVKLSRFLCGALIILRLKH